jgi:hypothetical protein
MICYNGNIKGIYQYFQTTVLSTWFSHPDTL